MDKDINLIAEAFCSYLADVIPPGASNIQVKETRRAFYAGALAMFNALCINGPEDYDPQGELYNFSQLVRKNIL